MFETLKIAKQFYKANKGSMATTIVMFLIVLLIFGALFSQILGTMVNVSDDPNMSEVPGGSVMVLIIPLLVIVVLVFWVLKKVRG